MLGTESVTTKNCKPSLITEKKSLPISIPRNTSKNNFLNDEDNNLNTNPSLHANFFNPGKSSPPDIWKSRLEDRIKNYCGNNIILIEK